MARTGTLLLITLAGITLGGLVPPLLSAPPPHFEADFSAPLARQWTGAAPQGDWRIADGLLQRQGSHGDTMLRAAMGPVGDVFVSGEFRVAAGHRRVFGIAVRVEGDNHLLVRYYDQPRALEVLAFKGKSWQQIGGRGPIVDVAPDTWYRLDVSVAGGQLRAALRPAAETSHPWHLQVDLPEAPPGGVAVVGHDDTRLTVREVKVWTDHPDLDQARAAAAGRLAELRSKLKLIAVPEAFGRNVKERNVRPIHVVTAVDGDRHPVAGELHLRGPGLDRRIHVEPSDLDNGAYRLEVEEPLAETPYRIALATELGPRLEAQFEITPRKYRRGEGLQKYVRTCLDTLIAHGRDDYGRLHTPLFMAVLDADTRRSPAHPIPLDALVRLEGRMHRRGERGCNLWYDQNLLKALYRISDLTGESSYREAADDYIRHFFEHCYKAMDPEHVYLNGMPAWGTHVYWDCFEDRPAGDGDGNGPHEILVFRAEWKDMYRVHPEGVRKTIDGIWRYHLVDQGTGLHNRHDDRRQGCDFAFSGSSFAHALAFLSHATGNPALLHQAKTVAGWHYNNRHAETGLTADCPGLSRRYDGNHCFTTVSGPHAMALLECYKLTSDPFFRDAAVGYIKAYDRFGWDDASQTYWAMLQLDGTPVPEQAKGTGYGAYAPYGHVNVWRTTFYSYEFTLSAAQAAMQAYEVSVADGAPDRQLLTIARRWGAIVERAMPAHTGRRWKAELEESMPRARETGGAYAEDYGRAISLFVHLHRATGEARFLDLAHELAEDAVVKLYHNGLFLGHAAKPYYESTNGVGLLLVALLELDAPDEDLGGAM